MPNPIGGREEALDAAITQAKHPDRWTTFSDWTDHDGERVSGHQMKGEQPKGFAPLEVKVFASKRGWEVRLFEDGKATGRRWFFDDTASHAVHFAEFCVTKWEVNRK